MIFERDSWQEIFATMKKNKLRTFLTAFGVFWGIFMLVIMLGSGSGLRHGVLKEFQGSATNSFFVWAQTTTKAYKGMKPGRDYNFKNADTKVLEQLEELDVVSPQNQLGGYNGGNNVTRGVKTGNFQVMGEFPSITMVENMRLREGRFINPIDITEKRKVCVIGPRVAEVLFTAAEKVVGDYIKINGVNFRVIGILIPQGSGQQYREQEQKIHIPFSTFQNAFNYGDIVGWFSITSKKEVPASVAEEKVIRLLKERHKVSPEDKQGVGHWNTEVQFNKMNGLFKGIEWLVWFVGAGTLAAGVIGVSNIMLIVVRERTKEIGVKRALGATPFHVTAQIMIESLFLTSVSGLLGLLAGMGSIRLINGLIEDDPTSMFQNPTVDLYVVLGALTILLVSGALAGLIPARKANAISPVEALRYE
ncbi:MAG: ABC transporter permease [Sediminibacterium sp.]|nr:ABC transporter permease [Sediminibacterium sp.]